MLLKILTIILFIVIGNNVLAGIVGYGDTAMIGRAGYYEGYEIPEFRNKQEAVDWAHKTKWVEPIRRLLKAEIGDLHKEALPYIPEDSFEKIKIVGKLMTQCGYCETALAIIEDYKKKGIKGDVVGNSFYAGSIPWRMK